MNFLNRLLFMLTEQMNGKEYTQEIKEYIKPLFAEKVFRNESLTSAQVLGVETIMREWLGMFSFKPGCLKGVPFIISLLKWLKFKETVDVLEIYKRDEWKKIVELRGPVESVLNKECKKCRFNYYAMGMSGFLDVASFVCSSCGNVYFQSIYLDTSVIPTCECGGTYISGCPHCGEHTGKNVHEISPYEYFHNHKYIRGEGA